MLGITQWGTDATNWTQGVKHLTEGGTAPPGATATRPDATQSRATRERNATAPPVVSPARPATSRAKRMLDLGLILITAPMILPLGLVIALIVVTTSRGPVFFAQERIGLGGRTFRMYKFRTMRPDAEEQLRRDSALWDEYVRNGYKVPPTADGRVTGVGRFLRRSSLDELPQVVNVVLGSMSLVGPRPVVPAELGNYGAHRDDYLSIKPGVTGPWQVNGRSHVSYPERVRIDCDYARSWSLWGDIVILARTPLAVVSARGAF